MEKNQPKKSRYRVFDKITTLFAEINEELTCTGIKLCINSEYAPEYLKEAAEQYAEAWQIDETAFVHGRGHRKTTQQRHYEKLREYAAKLEEYVEKIQNLWGGSQQLLENRSFGYFYANQDRLHGK